ncbi:hypothetical protein [Conexibacter woesei]|uniref:hypothetical protein n=1 Tax=Conexibacter woesei TaxID=191495 RepID=UPI000403E9A6|nr:hypothetical protein [Conexibacter woesei]
MRRAAWLIVATVLACAGLSVCLATRDPNNGDPVLNPVSLGLYAAVVVALGAVGYRIHRRLETAVMDAVLAGVVFAPALLLAALFVSTIAQCSFGSGC